MSWGENIRFVALAPWFSHRNSRKQTNSIRSTIRRMSVYTIWICLPFALISNEDPVKVARQALSCFGPTCLLSDSYHSQGSEAGITSCLQLALVAYTLSKRIMVSGIERSVAISQAHTFPSNPISLLHCGPTLSILWIIVSIRHFSPLRPTFLALLNSTAAAYV